MPEGKRTAQCRPNAMSRRNTLCAESMSFSNVKSFKNTLVENINESFNTTRKIARALLRVN